MYKRLTLEFILSTAFQEPVNFCHDKSKGLTHNQETSQYNRGKAGKRNSKDLYLQ